MVKLIFNFYFFNKKSFFTSELSMWIWVGQVVKINRSWKFLDACFIFIFACVCGHSHACPWLDSDKVTEGYEMDSFPSVCAVVPPCRKWCFWTSKSNGGCFGIVVSLCVSCHTRGKSDRATVNAKMNFFWTVPVHEIRSLKCMNEQKKRRAWRTTGGWDSHLWVVS